MIRFGLSVALAAAVAGCQTPRSTRLQVDDYEYMATEISGQLQRTMVEGFLAERGPDSEPMTVAIQKVTDYSHDMLSDGEKWYLMAKVRDTLHHRLRKEKNIVFVIPADTIRLARRMGDIEEQAAFENRAPTHVMNGVIRSVTRTTEQDRTDAYQLNCELTDLGVGEVVWTSKVEFKRVARGRAWD